MLDIQGWGRFDSKYVIAQAMHVFRLTAVMPTSLELEKGAGLLMDMKMNGLTAWALSCPASLRSTASGRSSATP